MAYPVYLLLGPENGEKEEKIKAIRGEIAKATNGSYEVHRYHPSDDGWETALWQDLTTSGFFSSWTIVVLEEAETLNKAQLKKLASYVAAVSAPHPGIEATATLLIVSDQPYLDRTLSGVVPKDATQVFYELSGERKERWVADRFRRSGITVTADGVRMLLDYVDNNTEALRGACDQLILFWQLEKKTGAVDAEAVQTYMANTKDADAFTLFPAIVSRNLPEALRILRQILAMGDSTTSYGLYAGLLYQMRRLLSFEEQYAATGNVAAAFQATTVLGKRAAIFTYPDKRLFQNALANWTVAQTRDMISCMVSYDIPLKGAGDMAPVMWEHLLCTLILHSGRPAPEPVFLVRPSF